MVTPAGIVEVPGIQFAQSTEQATQAFPEALFFDFPRVAPEVKPPADSAANLGTCRDALNKVAIAQKRGEHCRSSQSGAAADIVPHVNPMRVRIELNSGGNCVSIGSRIARQILYGAGVTVARSCDGGAHPSVVMPPYICKSLDFSAQQVFQAVLIRLDLFCCDMGRKLREAYMGLRVPPDLKPLRQPSNLVWLHNGAAFRVMARDVKSPLYPMTIEQFGHAKVGRMTVVPRRRNGQEFTSHWSICCLAGGRAFCARPSADTVG